MRCFITFSCYGTRLHGDESGSVDLMHNVPGSRVLETNPRRTAAERRRMTQPPYLLDSAARHLVLHTLEEVSSHRGWSLLAAPVRTNHVHAVVEAEVVPEKVMSDFKAYASRRLNALDHGGPERKRWARHASTRWLWKDQDVRDAIRYVIEEQGEAMAVFIGAAT